MAETRKRKKKTDNDLLIRNAGVYIIIVVCAGFLLLLLGGAIWAQNNDFNIKEKISSVFKNDSKIDEVKEEINNLNERKLFDATYFDALDTLSNLAYNTKWLDICPNSQTKIYDELYVKVCDSRFSSVSDVMYYYENILLKELTSDIISDNYINYNGSLFVKPFVVDKDETYLKMDSYSIKFKTNDKISYIVKSRYKTDGDDIEYKEHTFEIVKVGSSWVVSRFDLPL